MTWLNHLLVRIPKEARTFSKGQLTLKTLIKTLISKKRAQKSLL